MKYLSVTNPIWANSDHTAIDCLVDIEGIGVVPFTASPTDMYDYSKSIYMECLNGDYGPIAPLVEMTLEEAKALAWNRIKIARSIAEVGNFTFEDHVYQADTQRITGGSQLAFMAKVGGQPFSNTWTTVDNQVVDLTMDQMIAMGLALGRFVNGIYAIGRELREQINSSLTIEEVNAVKWPT